jgi:hypothetical protein
MTLTSSAINEVRKEIDAALFAVRKKSKYFMVHLILPKLQTYKFTEFIR